MQNDTTGLYHVPILCTCSVLSVDQQPSVGERCLQLFAGFYSFFASIETASYHPEHTVGILSQYGGVALFHHAFAKAGCIDFLSETTDDYIKFPKLRSAVYCIYLFVADGNRTIIDCGSFRFFRFADSNGCAIGRRVFLSLFVSGFVSVLARFARTDTEC